MYGPSIFSSINLTSYIQTRYRSSVQFYFEYFQIWINIRLGQRAGAGVCVTIGKPVNLILENGRYFIIDHNQIRQISGWRVGTLHCCVSGWWWPWHPAIWPPIRWHPPPLLSLLTPHWHDTMSWWQPDQWPTDLTQHGYENRNNYRELEIDWNECKFLCVLEYLRGPMTRCFLFTYANDGYLWRFQTGRDNHRVKSCSVFRSQTETGVSRSEGQQWLSAHQGSPENWNRLGIYLNERWL